MTSTLLALNSRNTAPVLFLALLWVQLCYVLVPSWQDASYYDFGWIIPPLIALMAWRRWQDLPKQAPSASTPRWAWIVVAVATLLLIPLRIVEHVDIYWRLPLWIHVLLVLGITHLTLALIHSRKASVELLPATLFILLAVPLPSALEQRLVHTLTESVIHLTGTLLPLVGYPATLVGSSFIVQGEFLDVTDGCSGIRSFQSCTMAALALGELLRTSLPRRILLLIASLGLAILGNAGRIFSLVRHAYIEGRASMDAHHDSLGSWAIISTYLGIALFAWLLTVLKQPRTVRRTQQ